MVKHPCLVLAVSIAAAARLVAGTPSTSGSTTSVGDLPFTSVDPFGPGITTLTLTGPETVAQVRQLEDLSGRVPNLFISGTSRRGLGDVYTLRGLGNAGLITDPAVGVYVDDVPLGQTFTYFQPLYDMDRVDVFRGPQPTLFGQNAEAGVISLHTNRADPREWHGQAIGSWSNYDGQEYRLSLGGPLIKDKLTLTLAGFSSLNTGFIDNTFIGNRRDDRDALGGRAVLRWTPAADWEIEAGIEAARAQDGSSRYVRLEEDRFRSFFSASENLGKLASDPFRVRSDEEGSLNLHQHREWLSLTKRFDTWQVRSITSHRAWEIDPSVQDLDLSPAKADLDVTLPAFFPLGSNDGRTLASRREQDIWTQELRFESLRPAAPKWTPCNDDAKKVVIPVQPANHLWWKAGLFFERSESSSEDVLTRNDASPQLTVVRGPDLVLPSLSGRGFHVPSYDFVHTTHYFPVQDRDLISRDEETWAGYAQAGYKFGAVEIDGGFRVDYTRKTFERTAEMTSVLPTLIGSRPLGLKLGPLFGTDVTKSRFHLSDDYDAWGFSPTLGLKIHLNDQTELFARSTYTYKPGGLGDAFSYDRETLWANEAGIRVSAWDGRFRTQLTGYYYGIDDYQYEVDAVGGISDGRNFVFNSDYAESYGVEWELALQLAHGLVFSGNLGYNQMHITGSRGIFTPEFTALAALDYAHDCGFRAHAEYVAIGDVNYGGQSYRQDAYGLLNARIGYERGHFGAYLFARNLTGKKYFTQKDYFPYAGMVGVIGEPRVIGVIAEVRF